MPLAISDKNNYNEKITCSEKVAFSMANEHTDKKMDTELENPADFTSPADLYQKIGRAHV